MCSVSKRSSKGVKREFGGCFKDVLRKFKKKSVSVFKDNLKKSFKGVSRMFQ